MSLTYPCIYHTEDDHCTHPGYCDDDYECWCVLGPCAGKTPSNADLIRQKTDKALAEWFVNQNHDCPPKREQCQDRKCFECWIGWLTAAAEGENGTL